MSSTAILHQRCSAGPFGYACSECGEEWPCRTTLKAQVEMLRSTLAEIQFMDCCYDSRVLADDALNALGSGRKRDQ